MSAQIPAAEWRPHTRRHSASICRVVRQSVLLPLDRSLLLVGGIDRHRGELLVLTPSISLLSIQERALPCAT
jgi:hypothetical protein